ncbi:MAG: TrmH family RNA methyltransferase [Nocardioides sp.]
MSTLSPAARLYSQVRRNLLPRHERLVAVAGRWPHEQLTRLGVRPELTLRCGDIAYAGALDINERTLARIHPGLSAPALLSVVLLPTWTPAEVLRPDARLLLVADGIEYAGNLGTLVRTADAAGADGLVLTNATCRLTHPKVFEASRSTVLTMPMLEYAAVAEARRDLVSAGFTTYVADPAAAIGYLDVDYGRDIGSKVAVVVGSEGDGVAAEWRTPDLTRVSIPMRGLADSLNVATSASVLLFDARARLR